MSLLLKLGFTIFPAGRLWTNFTSRADPEKVNGCGYRLRCSLNISLSDSCCFWDNCSVMACPRVVWPLGIQEGAECWQERRGKTSDPAGCCGALSTAVLASASSLGCWHADQGCAPRPLAAAEGSRGRRPARGNVVPSLPAPTVSQSRPRGPCVRVCFAWPRDPAQYPALISHRCPSRLLSGCLRSRSCSL